MKKYTILPRGMTWDQVNETIREKQRKEVFVDKLKNGEDEFIPFSHDGTDFGISHSTTHDFKVIKNRGNGDFDVAYI